VKLEQKILKAILVADLQQYSRLVAADEGDTLDYVSHCFRLFQQHCEPFGAEFVKTTGDGVMILFDSASSAVEYAMSVQERIGALEQARPGHGKFRIGLHMGEVRRSGQDVYGHAVNMANRVEAKALPGGVCVTQDVYRASRDSTRYGFRFAGRPALKHMPEPVSLYHVTATKSPADKSASQLTISVIDGLALTDDDGEPVDLRSREAQALIGHLALSSQYQAHQDRLATLLWPDKSLAEARRRLAARLQLVEKAITRGSTKRLLRRGGIVGLNPAFIAVDLVRLFEDVDEGHVDDLLLYRPDCVDSVLLGFDDVSSLFSAWLSVTRHNRHDGLVEALQVMLDRFEVTEQTLRRAATALLILEPSHERAAQQLIRHYLAAGNVAAAMRVYQGLRSVLLERFDIAPSDETTALVQRLSGASGSEEPAKAPRPGARTASIAIGRFQAHGEGVGPVASGFRSELVAVLSKFREWTVVEADEGSERSAELEYSLTAECVGNHDQVKMYVTLAEPSTRGIVWSDSFDLALRSWSSAQKRLVAKIASTLEVYLSHHRLSRVLPGPLHDLGAYDCWLRGEHLLTHWSVEAEDEAERMFEQAIANDPGFAAAHASLASVYNSRQFIRPGIARDEEQMKLALKLALRAVEIDPLDARNHLVVAWSTAMAKRFEQSELHFSLAAELNPNSPKTLVSAAVGLAFMGRADQARELLDHATSLTARFMDYQWCYIATTRYFLGDMEGVTEAAERSNNVIADTPGWKAAALLALGRPDEARAALFDLHASASRIWQGGNAPEMTHVLDWFLAAFPIRNEQDKAGLGRLRELI
jgi:class 3 adenylate cyclase/DNA-binding SARP family transcriptional activator